MEATVSFGEGVRLRRGVLGLSRPELADTTKRPAADVQVCDGALVSQAQPRSQTVVSPGS